MLSDLCPQLQICARTNAHLIASDSGCTFCKCLTNAYFLQISVSYSKTILYDIPPWNITLIPASGLWELPQNLNKTTTDAERHNQAAAAELSLPPLANTMQMSCAEHDPGCPEASTPLRCLVCQQENDCRENDSSLTLALRCSPLHMRHRRTGNRGDH